nr:hypothetical protein [Tanacetum cinerariifolium]
TVPPKVARKFKKVSSSKKDSVPVAADEEPVQKDKRVKTSVKKSLTALTTCFVIREPHVETRGSGLVAKKPPSVEKITPPVTSEGTGDKPGVPDVTKDESTENSEQGTDGSESGSKFDQQDDDEVKENDNDDDKSEGDEDKGINSDDVQDKKADVRMTNAQQEKKI